LALLVLVKDHHLLECTENAVFVFKVKRLVLKAHEQQFDVLQCILDVDGVVSLGLDYAIVLLQIHR
jgi:hypothetical protein